MNKLLIVTLLSNIVFSAEANGQCPSADRYCMNCETTKCGDCIYSYPDATTGQCKPPTTAISYCVTYSNATTCEDCDTGYYKSGNACVKISIDNCKHVDDEKPTFCVVCDDGK